MLPMPARLRLVEQRLAERAVGVGRGAGAAPRPRPSRGRAGPGRGARRRRLLGGRGEQLDDAEGEARPPAGSAVVEHDPGLVRRARPALARRRRPARTPSILRWVCRVQRVGAAVDPGEQVLAAGDGLDDGAAGQVGGGELGDPEVGAGEHAGPRSAAVEPPGGAVDGVALRHPAAAAPAGWRRSRRRASASRSGVGAGRRAAASPSAFSTVSRPSEPRRAASASAAAAGVEPVGVVAPGEQGAAAALDVERQRAVDEDHQRAGLAARAGGRRSLVAGPGQGGAVGVGRVGGGERDRGRLARRRSASLNVRSRSMAPAVPNWAAPRPLDEVAAPAAAGLLERRRAPCRPPRSRRAPAR